MKYAIVSDIHANQQAWKAVWLDIRSMVVDKIICLGDSIGYGPNPVEILESLYETVDYFVLGNHEAALCGKIDVSSFNECGRDMIIWTRERVGRPAIQFLSEHPLTLAGPRFRCAHGEFANSGRFCYAFEANDAMPSWNAVDEPLLFVGHTHRPCIMILGKSGTPRMIEPEDFALEEEKRFLVNVGSVGQPRDGGTRASYCLYDSEAGSVYWRKIPFDLDAYRDALEQAEIPSETSPFLEFDPRKGRPPLRELVPFRPPSEPVRDTLAVQYVDKLEQKIRKWKALFWTGIGLLAIALTLGGGIWMRHKNRTLDMPGTGMSAVRAADFAPESNLLSFPQEPVPPGNPMPNWNVHVGDRYGQETAWAPIEGDKPGFVLRSNNARAELCLSSAPLHVSPGMRLCLRAGVKKSPAFSGNLAIVLLLVQQADSPRNTIVAASPTISFETNRNFAVKEPNLHRRDGWSLAQQTVNLPARSHSVIFQIRGKFQGTAFIRDIRLEQKK